MADYTLPPLPPCPYFRGWTTPECVAVEAYGKACAEAARAPLLKRVDYLGECLSEAQARIRELDHRLLRRATVVEEQKARIAELEADAKRYRWLRQPNALHRAAHIAVLTHNGGYVATEGLADDAIDAAMKANAKAPPSQPVALPDDAMVERLAVWLRGNARFRVSLSGHIDEDWDREYARDILAAAFAASPAGEGVPRG